VAEALADPTRKDVVIAIMGASAALGGLTLVFLGLLISAFQGFSPVPARVRRAWTRTAVAILAAFLLTIATVGAALIWLSVPGGTCLYRVVIAMFAAELVAIVAVAVLTTARLL
jgi:hypothetical protein